MKSLFFTHKSQSLIATALIGIGALSRLIPHPPNMVPIIAIAVFGAWTFPNYWIALAITIGSMFISDVGLALFKEDITYLSYSMLPVVYGTLGVIILISRIVGIRRTFFRGVAALLIGSTLFFIVTNFFVWLIGSLYPHTIEGLLLCFSMALPFYPVNDLTPFELVRNALLGDLIYGGILFGSFALARRLLAESNHALRNMHSGAIGG